ncbi:hypothetical protein HDR63_01905 [bacterium]|nr:hypothetical protein [bacterium]
MAKKQQVEPRTETASELINKLVAFYNNCPEYETPILEIFSLSRLAHQELKKFISRPHTQVTKIYFDDDVRAAEARHMR